MEEALEGQGGCEAAHRRARRSKRPIGVEARAIAREPTRQNAGAIRTGAGLGIDVRRRNAEQLIKARLHRHARHRQLRRGGARVCAHAEADLAGAGDRDADGIEGLVELGYDAVAGDRRRRRRTARSRARALEDFGTIEAGKLADILVLDADPLADIKNIRKISVLVRDGRVIDRAKLPTAPVMFRQGTTN